MDQALIPRFLPENYRFAAARPDGVLAALLAVMDGMHAPAEAAVDALDAHVRPLGAPDAFVLLQASWLGLDRYFEWSGDQPGAGAPRFRAGVDRLRLLVAEAATLGRERGTNRALVRFLELATGRTGFRIGDGGPRPFHVTIAAPADAAPLRDLVERIVAGERPAHATYDLLFEPPPKPEGPAP